MNVRLSFLDRLVKSRSNLAHKDNADCKDLLRLLQKNLMNDLMWLLNTRQLDWKRKSEIPRTLEEVNRSLFLYGLPDFSEEKDPREIEILITHTIRQFEPRLKVSVHHLPDQDPKNSSSMSFRIKAQIQLDPVAIPFLYEPVVEVESGRCRIRSDR